MTVLGMVTTQRLELFTDGTHPLLLPLADLGMLEYPLHLMTRGQLTVGVATVESVRERLYTAQDGVLVRVLVRDLSIQKQERNQ